MLHPTGRPKPSRTAREALALCRCSPAPAASGLIYVALVGSLCACEPGISTPSQRARGDDSAGSAASSTSTTAGNQHHARIGQALAAMAGLGPHAQADYRKVVSTLKSAPGAVVAARQALRRAVLQRSAGRWRHLMLVNELEDSGALPLLLKIAREQPRSHGVRTTSAALRPRQPASEDEDAKVRRLAVWSVERLAKKRAARALEGLRGLLRARDREVRIEAALALFRLNKITERDRRVMASQGMSGSFRVLPSERLIRSARPSRRTMERARQKLKAAAQRPYSEPPPMPAQADEEVSR